MAPPTTDISTLSLHDALPISPREPMRSSSPASPSNAAADRRAHGIEVPDTVGAAVDRKSTRLNSSHTVISYAVFCLKKKKPFGPNSRIYALEPAAEKVKEMQR